MALTARVRTLMLAAVPLFMSAGCGGNGGTSNLALPVASPNVQPVATAAPAATAFVSGRTIALPSTAGITGTITFDGTTVIEPGTTLQLATAGPVTGESGPVEIIGSVTATSNQAITLTTAPALVVTLPVPSSASVVTYRMIIPRLAYTGPWTAPTSAVADAAGNRVVTISGEYFDPSNAPLDFTIQFGSSIAAKGPTKAD